MRVLKRVAESFGSVEECDGDSVNVVRGAVSLSDGVSEVLGLKEGVCDLDGVGGGVIVRVPLAVSRGEKVRVSVSGVVSEIELVAILVSERDGASNSVSDKDPEEVTLRPAVRERVRVPDSETEIVDRGDPDGVSEASVFVSVNKVVNEAVHDEVLSRDSEVDRTSVDESVVEMDGRDGVAGCVLDGGGLKDSLRESL